MDTHNSKPLPLIPCSASAHEFRDAISPATNDQTASANSISSLSSRSNNIDRPLPPIPRDNSLEKVDESTSDNTDISDNDIDEVEIEENHSDDDMNNKNEENEIGSHDKTNSDSMTDDGSFDADATLPPLPTHDESFIYNGLDYDKDTGYVIFKFNSIKHFF